MGKESRASLLIFLFNSTSAASREHSYCTVWPCEENTQRFRNRLREQNNEDSMRTREDSDARAYKHDYKHSYVNGGHLKNWSIQPTAFGLRSE